MKALILLTAIFAASFAQAKLDTCTTKLAHGFKIVYLANVTSNGQSEITQAQLVYGDDALPLISIPSGHKNEIILSHQTAKITIDITSQKAPAEVNGEQIIESDVSVVGVSEPDVAESGEMTCSI